MKTLILQGDGIASLPSPELEGKTLLQVVSTSGLDFLARYGEYGVLKFPNDTSGLSGAIVSISDLHLGIGLRAGLEAIDVNQNSSMDESMFMKYAQVTEMLFRRYDLVYLHIEEKPNFSSGYAKEKIKRIEAFDQQLVCQLLERLPTFGDYRVVVICNYWHPLPEDSGVQPTPFIFFESNNIKDFDSAVQYSEVEAGASSVEARDATQILDQLFNKNRD